MSWAEFLWRNLSRNKLRSLLTGGAIALVCFLATMPDAMNRILDQFAINTRIVFWTMMRASSIWSCSPL